MAAEKNISKFFDAIDFVNNVLWQRDQTNFTPLNMLDHISVSADGISGWIFTSSDGLVKSKSKGRWQLNAIMERCAPTLTEINVQYTDDGITWRMAPKETLSEIINRPRRCLIASYAHISPLNGRNQKYLEQTFILESKPKYTTSLLCGTMAKGLVSKEVLDSIIPTERVTCLNKELIELGRSFIQDLVKIIESKAKAKVFKISVVLMIENETAFPSSSGKPNRKLWYHHATEIVHAPLQRKNSSAEDETPRQSAMEKRSVTCSTITERGGSFTRVSKCVGDFCPFDEEDEIKNMEVISGPDDMRREARKARRRHRKLDDDDEDDLEAMLANGEDDDDRIEEDGEKSKLPMKSQASKVPYMSIVLARKEMTEIESDKSDSGTKIHTVWPENLLHWWSRVGRTVAMRKGFNAMPSTSAHAISAAILP